MPFKSDEGGRGEAAVRRAKAHLGREDPIAWFGLAVRRILREGNKVADGDTTLEKVLSATQAEMSTLE